jgi:uncharacterized protein (TIGR00730 family)
MGVSMSRSETEAFLKAQFPTLGGEEYKLAIGLLDASTGLVADQPELIDLKITASAVAEMRAAFAAFAPYRRLPKVTIFGSARTQADDPLYAQAQDVARLFAAQGWMVVTGAGPGIMAAASEGAGRAHSFGVNIRLPFESGANPFIDADTKLVSMKYFFTRKLMLMKESKAYICLPGGFGTLDETFELLTLTQTGKGTPAPIVFLDTPGETFWGPVHDLITSVLLPRGLIEMADLGLYLLTDQAQIAVDEINGFYRNYHSIRFFGDELIIRVQHAPTAAALDALNVEFADICTGGSIALTTPRADEIDEDDHPELPRLTLPFDKRHWNRLRALINALNER